MNKRLVGVVSIAAAGGGLLMGCTRPSAPAPQPVPALGCYTGHPDADIKVVGLVGEADAMEAFDPGSGCTTNDSVGPVSVSFVQAADETEAETLCTDLDPANNAFFDLSAATTPAPGLAGYWACSAK